MTIDANAVITEFVEKPPEPKSTMAAIALYYYSRSIVPLFTTYLAAGNNPDQPGRFLQWLYSRKPVKTFQIKGLWLDIGSKETLEEADQIFEEAWKVTTPRCAASAAQRAYLLFQPSFVELDEVEIGFDVFPAFAAGFLQEMEEPGFLGGGIGMTRNHRLVPVFD